MFFQPVALNKNILNNVNLLTKSVGGTYLVNIVKKVNIFNGHLTEMKFTCVQRTFLNKCLITNEKLIQSSFSLTIYVKILIQNPQIILFIIIKKEDSKVTYTLIIYPNSLIYEPPITAAFVQKNSGQTKSSSRWIA